MAHSLPVNFNSGDPMEKSTMNGSMSMSMSRSIPPGDLLVNGPGSAGGSRGHGQTQAKPVKWNRITSKSSPWISILCVYSNWVGLNALPRRRHSSRADPNRKLNVSIIHVFKSQYFR